MTGSGAGALPARLVLDTAAYSHLRRGRDDVIDGVAEAELVYVPATVVGELEAGFRLGGRYAANRRSLQELLDEPFVEVIDTTVDVARRYGEVLMQLRRAGTPIPVNDIWIAAAVLSTGAHLLTFDTDFSKVDGLSHTILA